MLRRRLSVVPVIGACLTLGTILAACGGGGSSPTYIISGPSPVPATASPTPSAAPTATPSPTPSPSPGALTVNVSGTLGAIGSTAVITASQAGYSGPFIFTSSDGTIIGLVSNLSSSGRTPKGAPLSVTANKSVTAVVLGSGTASITVAGAGGQSSAPPGLTGLVVGPTPSPSPSPTPSPSPSPSPTPAAIVLTPSVLNFISLQPQQFTASAAGYSGIFTATSANCASIATIAITGPGLFTVTPLAAGTCTITISNTPGATATLTVGVTLTTVGGS